MQNLLQELTELLGMDDRLVSEGRLMKNKIVELALAVDPLLMKHLLRNQSMRRHFFTEVEGAVVFDKIKFQRFVSNKSFLPDSYTAYKNKIGLTSSDNGYLADAKDVVLSWPYKDCVLEGGQDREDSKRAEVFWNETLAPDQIDRLLSPKVITNAKRYTADGVSQVTEISDADNLIVKGNNLLVLETLKKVYAGQVDLIYIDPPFNTESDSFQYNDKFTRSSWLSFMRSRLVAAKQMLKNTGTIYVHVDHNEGHYLKVLMDEIFGEENFRNEIIWHYSGWNKKLSNSFERRHDTIFMYSKSPAQYFASYFETWASKEEYVKRRKQKLLMDEDGREYVLSDAGGGRRVKMFIEDVLKGGVVVDDVWHIDKLNNSAKESVGFQTQKIEGLIERIITASCPEGGLVLDFHLGSGTTAAVAHKMGRKYIGIEQMNYIESVTVPRLVNVLKGEKEGVSAKFNWQGGGSFVYCELAKANQTFADAILVATSGSELVALWEQMKERAFLSYQVDVAAFDESKSDFKSLDLGDQKRFLLEVLDKNMLYVPLSEIEDKTFAVSKEDQDLNRKFFKASMK